MIAKPSIAFNEFSASAKAVTARSVHGRTILSSKAYHTAGITPAQAVSRNSLSKISRAYKQLSYSQMKSWESLALHLKSKPSLGTSTRLTAHNAFVRINSNRQMLGLSLLDTAPCHINNIPAVTYGNIWVTDRRVLISGIEAPSPDYRLVVRMSAGQSTGVSSGWDRTVIITPGMADDWGDVPLTKLYNDKIGFLPKENEKVFIGMSWIDPDSGMTGDLTRVSVICTSEAAATADGFVERAVLDSGNITKNEGIAEFKAELTPGPAFFTTEALCLGHSNIASSVAELENLPEVIVNCDSYIVGRGPADGEYDSYAPQTAVVWIRKSSSGDTITYAHRGGPYRKPIEYFGTGVMIP